jgi:hypothetical protein
MERSTSEERLFLYDTYVKYGTARKCWGKFRDETNNLQLVNQLILRGLKKHKRRVLTEGKLDDIGARLEYTPRKLLKRLPQETDVSKPSARRATQLLKLRPYRKQ